MTDMDDMIVPWLIAELSLMESQVRSGDYSFIDAPPESVLLLIEGSRGILAEHEKMSYDCRRCTVFPVINTPHGFMHGPANPGYPCNTVKMLAKMWGWKEE